MRCLTVVFASVLSGKTCLKEFQVLETRGKFWSKEDFSLVEEDEARECLNELAIHKSMGPDGRHWQVLRALGNVIVRQFSIICERP